MKLGDANTNFFHVGLKQRRLANFIARLKEDDGTWLEKEEEIKEIKDSVVNYFSSLFSDRRDTIPRVFPHSFR